MKHELLTRDKFRESVFERDNYKCVMCGDFAVDAHHIMERRLFNNDTFGYFIDNGASLCSCCHILAEQTLISPQELRDKIDIKNIILPPHLYRDAEYDKWGNEILQNGMRLKGELFYDESVQKILKEGDVLNSFSNYIKYPRTYHLPWSPGTTKDDRIMKDIDTLLNNEVVITLKMDGENCVDENTKIQLNNGIEKFIKDLTEKDEIISFNLDKKEKEKDIIEKITKTKTIISDVWYEIELDDGTIINITGNHYVFLPELNCYRQVKFLKENQDKLLVL